MITDKAVRAVEKKKLRKLIRNNESMLLLRRPYTVSEAHEISELRVEKLKFQLRLNSLMLEEAKSDGEKKELEKERKELRNALVVELKNGVEILDSLVENLKGTEMRDEAEGFEILRDVRESELEELTGGKTP